MKYKLSNYCEVIKINPKLYAIFNKVNGCLLKIETSNLSTYDNSYWIELNKNKYQYLNEREFFVSDYFVQQKIQEEGVVKKTNNSATITISVTERCNCSCKYCYQVNWNKKNSLPDEQYFKIIHTHILQVIQELKPKSALTIRFIGGEPLLKEKFILKIYDDIHSLVLESHKNLLDKYLIDTNCMLLTEEFIKHFDNLNISTTLTLRDDHNKFRSNSYDTTVKHILKCNYC